MTKPSEPTSPPPPQTSGGKYSERSLVRPSESEPTSFRMLATSPLWIPMVALYLPLVCLTFFLRNGTSLLLGYKALTWKKWISSLSLADKSDQD